MKLVFQKLFFAMDAKELIGVVIRPSAWPKLKSIKNLLMHVLVSNKADYQNAIAKDEKKKNCNRQFLHTKASTKQWKTDFLDTNRIIRIKQILKLIKWYIHFLDTFHFVTLSSQSITQKQSDPIIQHSSLLRNPKNIFRFDCFSFLFFLFGFKSSSL